MTALFRFALVFEASLALSACGSSGGSGSSSSGGGTGGATTGGGATTTGGSAAKPYQGYVIFGSEDIGASYYSGQAGFSTATSLMICASGTTKGSCCYVSAAAGQAYGQKVPPSNLSAGAITLEKAGATLATLPFTSGTGYAGTSSATDGSFGWSAGDTLGATAAGDASGVAAFSGTVVAPADLAAVSPAFTTLSTISRSSDFDLTWTAGGSGTVTLTMRGTTSARADDGEIICSVLSGSGSLTISATLLANFQSGDLAEVSLTVSNDVSLPSPNATIELTAETEVDATASLQ